MLSERPSDCHAFSLFFRNAAPNCAKNALPARKEWQQFSPADKGKHPTPKAFASKASNPESIRGCSKAGVRQKHIKRECSILLKWLGECHALFSENPTRLDRHRVQQNRHARSFNEKTRLRSAATRWKEWQ